MKHLMLLLIITLSMFAKNDIFDNLIKSKKKFMLKEGSFKVNGDSDTLGKKFKHGNINVTLHSYKDEHNLATPAIYLGYNKYEQSASCLFDEKIYTCSDPGIRVKFKIIDKTLYVKIGYLALEKAIVEKGKTVDADRVEINATKGFVKAIAQH